LGVAIEANIAPDSVHLKTAGGRQFVQHREARTLVLHRGVRLGPAIQTSPATKPIRMPKMTMMAPKSSATAPLKVSIQARVRRPKHNQYKSAAVTE
jgi:hypothetical protein